MKTIRWKTFEGNTLRDERRAARFTISRLRKKAGWKWSKHPQSVEKRGKRVSVIFYNLEEVENLSPAPTLSGAWDNVPTRLWECILVLCCFQWIAGSSQAPLGGHVYSNPLKTAQNQNAFHNLVGTLSQPPKAFGAGLRFSTSSRL